MSFSTQLNLRFYTSILLCVGAAILFFIPYQILFNGNSWCIHKNLIGFECPGCGMTRALYSLLHADLRTALGYNFCVVILLPVIFIEIYLGFNYSERLSRARKITQNLLAGSLCLIYLLRASNFFLFHQS